MVIKNKPQRVLRFIISISMVLVMCGIRICISLYADDDNDDDLRYYGTNQ